MVLSFLRIENPGPTPDLCRIQKGIKPSTGFSYVFKISPKNTDVKNFAPNTPSIDPERHRFALHVFAKGVPGGHAEEPVLQERI
jgi:hypothetical protein